MAANVSEIINNVFEKVFENPEISFSHPKAASSKETVISASTSAPSC